MTTGSGRFEQLGIHQCSDYYAGGHRVLLLPQPPSQLGVYIQAGLTRAVNTGRRKQSSHCFKLEPQV